MVAPRSVLIEADGGSRGNPGPAAYGAVLKDASTGQVIADRAEKIGFATNNVAEYRGLIAGLELYHEFAEGAELEVRMDSKLVVEQMSGRWKIKHPDMKPLALQASRMAPPDTTYTWVPREQNKYADRILNEALDGRRVDPFPQTTGDPVVESAELVKETKAPLQRGLRRTTLTLVLVRHGETELTRERRFSGRGGSDPELNSTGRDQVWATADWLKRSGLEVDAYLSSPLRRTLQSAEIIAEELGGVGLDQVEVVDGMAEGDFAEWDGFTFEEVREQEPDAFDAWLGSIEVRPGGTGETLVEIHQRVEEAITRIREGNEGKTLLVCSHVTPIKAAVINALGWPIESQFGIEVSPASVTVVSYYPDGSGVLRAFNAGRELTAR